MKEKKSYKLIIILFIVMLFLDQVAKSIALINGWNIDINSDTTNNGYYIVMTLIIIVMIIRYITNENAFIKQDTKIILSFALAGGVRKFNRQNLE